MSIQQYLDKIKNAVYGREVRGAIHDAIKQTYDDAAEGGDANMEVKLARGTFPNLNARLDNQDNKITNNTNQLVRKANKNEINALATDKADKSYVDEGLARKRDKSKLIGLNDLDEEVLQAIGGGEGTEFTIEAIPKDYSVTPKKTTFATKGKNLFEGEFLHGVIVAGDVNNSIIASRDGGYSAVQKVEKNETYTLYSGDTADRHVVVATVGPPEVGGAHRLLTNFSTTQIKTVTLQGDEDHILAYLSTPTQDTEPVNFQIEKGDTFTGYESPDHVRIKLTEGAVESYHINKKAKLELSNAQAFLAGGTTTFDVREEDEEIRTVFAGGFVIVGNERYNLKDGFWSYSHITENTIIVCFDTETSDILFFNLTDIQKDENKKYPILGVIRRGFSVNINGMHSVNRSTVIPFRQEDKDNIDLALKTGGRKYFIDDNLHGEYRPSFTFIDPISVTDVEGLYDIYDDLVTKYPNYVSRQTLGTVTNGLPIYQYTFKPETINVNGQPMDIPTIPIVHGIHGMEKYASVGATRFYIDLCENWKNDHLLRALRFNVELKVIPVANPTAFNLMQRKNANGVDIARNFPEGWNQDGGNGDPNSDTYAGPSPASELETQVLMNWIDENKDALLMIDMHNYTPLNNAGTVLWTRSEDIFINNFLSGYVQAQSSYAQSNYDLDEQWMGKALGNTGTSVRDGSFTKQAHKEGVNAALLETTINMHTGQEDVQDFNASALGNMILSSLRNLA